MNLPSASTKLYLHLARFVLFFLAASISFNGFYQKWHFAEGDVAGDDTRTSFQAMVEGAAYRPYIYRQLIPQLANGIDRITPPRAKTWLYERQTAEDPLLYAISGSSTAMNPQYFFRYLAMYATTFLFALLAVYAMYLVCAELGLSAPAATFAPVLMILLLPYFMSNGGFAYDFPELAFFALASYLALRAPWGWLLPVVLLGEGNKESFLLFVLTLYPLFRRRGSRTSALTGTAVLSFACLAVYALIRHRFAHNPGGTVETWWLDQLRYLTHPASLFFGTEETYGVRALKLYTVFPMALLLWTISRGWKHLPLVVRQHGLIGIVLMVPLYILFSAPGELRDFSVLYIVLLTILATLLDRWIDASRAPQATVTTAIH